MLGKPSGHSKQHVHMIRHYNKLQWLYVRMNISEIIYFLFDNLAEGGSCN